MAEETNIFSSGQARTDYAMATTASSPERTLDEEIDHYQRILEAPAGSRQLGVIPGEFNGDAEAYKNDIRN